MSLIADITRELSDTIARVLPEVTTTTNALEIKPALSAGRTVAWIGAPERIRLDAPLTGVAEYEIALVSPDPANHMDGLDSLTAAAALTPPLGISEIRPDAITIGNGPTFPALFLTFELPYTLEES